MLRQLKNLYRNFDSWMAYNPPGALTSKGWRLFEEEFAVRAPIRYYLHHTFREKYIHPARRKYRRVSEWVRYRTYDRYHVVHTGLTPGYHDLDTQMLHVNFNMLKDFVEVEQAWQSFWFDEDSEKIKWKGYIPFYKIYFRSTFRMPERGVKYFEWASALDDPLLPATHRAPEQAATAREVLALYNWWVKERPARSLTPSVEYSDQGLGILGCLDDDFDSSANDYQENQKIMEENSEKEARWEKEDDEMLIRLITIRKRLWT